MLSMVVIVAFGLEAVMALVSEAFTLIKLAGAAYLVWIGFKMFTSSGKLSLDPGSPGRSREKLRAERRARELEQSEDAALPRRVPAAVRRHEPARLRPDHGARAHRHGGRDSVDCVYAVIAGRARKALTAARVRMLSRVSGAILMAGGVWLALQRRS